VVEEKKRGCKQIAAPNQTTAELHTLLIFLYWPLSNLFLGFRSYQ